MQPKRLTLAEALNKQLGIEKEVDVQLAEDVERPSTEWQAEHTVSLIEKYERKHLDTVWLGDEIAGKKKAALENLKTEIRQNNGSSLASVLAQAKRNPVYNQHRLFALQDDELTATQEFIADLPERVHAI